MDCKNYDAKILFEDHGNYWHADLYQKEMKIAVENGYIRF
jgi:hypothetical protein